MARRPTSRAATRWCRRAVEAHGLIGWFFWLFIHIAFLTGFRNRVGAIMTWWVAFTRDVRRERAFTEKPVGLLQAIYAATGQSG